MAPLEPVNRYVTTHGSDGKATHLQKLPPYETREIPGFGTYARAYSVKSVPANLSDGQDLNSYFSETGETSYKKQSLVLGKDGANVIVNDLEPGGVSHLHQTQSIDFDICVQGLIDHELDSGEVVRMKPGDFVIQRSTMHKWRNVSDTEPARFIAVTLPALPFKVDGKIVEEVHLPPDA